MRRFGDDIQFMVEEMVVIREEVPWKADPLLRADLTDGSSYYLEVWDEPAFDGQRVV